MTTEPAWETCDASVDNTGATPQRKLLSAADTVRSAGVLTTNMTSRRLLSHGTSSTGTAIQQFWTCATGLQ
eukprot:9503998-Pyramimonas_sp.AAC.1